MIVRIPSQLFSYTGGRKEVAAQGHTVGEVLRDLDRQFPGLRFRIVDEQGGIRPHIKIFVREEMAGGLEQELGTEDTLQIIGALSGG
jgi:molybdopterin converting factor small subunit